MLAAVVLADCLLTACACPAQVQKGLIQLDAVVVGMALWCLAISQALQHPLYNMLMDALERIPAEEFDTPGLQRICTVRPQASQLQAQTCKHRSPISEALHPLYNVLMGALARIPAEEFDTLGLQRKGALECACTQFPFKCRHLLPRYLAPAGCSTPASCLTKVPTAAWHTHTLPASYHTIFGRLHRRAEDAMYACASSMCMFRNQQQLCTVRL